MKIMCPMINENHMYSELNHIVFLHDEMLNYCNFDDNKKNELTKIADEFYHNFLDIALEFEFENRNSLY